MENTELIDILSNHINKYPKIKITIEYFVAITNPIKGSIKQII